MQTGVEPSAEQHDIMRNRRELLGKLRDGIIEEARAFLGVRRRKPPPSRGQICGPIRHCRRITRRRRHHIFHTLR